MAATIPSWNLPDEDWPGGIHRVLVFNENDKYRIKGKTHNLRSNTIRYLMQFQRNKFNKALRNILKLIKHEHGMYMLNKTHSIMAAGIDAYKLVKQPNYRPALINTMDFIHDKDRLNQPLSNIELQILDIVNTLIPIYIKEVKAFQTKGVNIDTMSTEQLQNIIETGAIIRFSASNNDIITYDIENAIILVMNSRKFKTMRYLELNTKDEVIAYWQSIMDNFESENFKWIINNLKKIDIKSYRKELSSDRQDVRAKLSKDSLVNTRPLDKEVRYKVEREIISRFEQMGLKPKSKRIGGIVYWTAKDKNGHILVYDYDGKLKDIDTVRELSKERQFVQNRINNIHKLDVYLGSISKVSDKVLENLIQSQEIKYDILSDSSDIKKKVSRTYPVVMYKGKKLIAGGRFRGYYLEDMINSAGRMIAGTAYTIDRNNVVKPIEYKDGDLTKYRVENEPYLTKTETGTIKLILPLWDKRGISAIDELRKTYKTIVSGDDPNSFEIDSIDFDIINEALGGVVMSQEVADEITTNIKNRKRLIQIEEQKLYEDISVNNIPGMASKDSKGRPYDFMTHQKKAIAITAERDGNTVVGLDTGTGKTLVGIGLLMKWINDGTLSKDGKNGKALFVVPPSLKGNFPAQIREFVENYEDVRNKIEIISYTEFQANTEAYADYGAIFFDEAQKLRKLSAKVSKAALELNHPRKIPMTASVMEKDPQDLFNLVSIATNSYSDPERYRKMQRTFINTFCEKVGNKVVGLKEDRETIEKFRRWVKAHTVYIEKTDVDEILLPPVTAMADMTDAVTMSPEMVKEYNKLIRPIKDTIRRMVEKYKEKELKTTDISQEMSRTLGQIQRIKSFLNNPDDYIPISNPKIDRAEDLIEAALLRNDSTKTITFTDSPTLAEKSGRLLSLKFPHKKHVVGLAGKILVYQNGKIVEKYSKTTKLFDTVGNRINPSDWQVFLIGRFNKDNNVCTINLTSAYTTGHNIQSASMVINYDRNSWNNENMKQRIARCYRTGQTQSVIVKTIDMVNDEGTSLDTIQKYSMEIEQQLFDDAIKASAGAKLKDNISITDAKGLVKNKEALRYLLDASLSNSYDIENASVTYGTNPETGVPVYDKDEAIKLGLLKIGE